MCVTQFINPEAEIKQFSLWFPCSGGTPGSPLMKLAGIAGDEEVETREEMAAVSYIFMSSLFVGVP